MRQLAANARRFARILRVLAVHGLAWALGPAAARRPWLARRFPTAALPGPERLRALIEELGGTFIKFGQMLALQPDILSIEYCNALFNLLDRVPAFAYEEVERVFREELGRSPDELFEGFERRPLATASIGQVHVAFRGGVKWAVKVQRPAVDVEFAGDIRLMAATVALIRRLRLAPLYWMIEPMSEFMGWTREELDYRNEARYMEQLRANASGNEVERVPAIDAGLSTRRILVVEFMDGVTVLDYLRALETGDEVLPRRLAEAGFEPDRFARHMIDNFLGDAFRFGLFHADLHPANLMILPDNVVGYVDFGITGVLSRYSRRHLVELTLTYTRADLDGMASAFLQVSAKGRRFDLEGFREGLQAFAEEWYEGRDNRLRKNFTLMMLDMLRLSHKTDVWPERDVIKYIRSSIAIDGLITRFAPSFEVGRYLAVVCDRYLRLEGRYRLLSYENLFEWARAGSGLAIDGPLRAAALIGRPLPGGRARPGQRPETGGRASSDDPRPRRAAVRYGAIAFGLALLMAAAPAEPTWGPTLFTAQALALAAAAALWARSTGALARRVRAGRR